MVAQRDKVLMRLCEFALPQWSPASASGAPYSPGPAMLHHSSGRGDESPTVDAAGLTVTNIMALKALFNIAHCLGNMLGSAWVLLLDTFQQFDASMTQHGARSLLRNINVSGLGSDGRATRRDGRPLSQRSSSSGAGDGGGGRDGGGGGGGGSSSSSGGGAGGGSGAARLFGRLRGRSRASPHPHHGSRSGSSTPGAGSGRSLGSAGDGTALDDELAILAAALSSLFESSQHLTDDAGMQKCVLWELCVCFTCVYSPHLCTQSQS